MGAVITILLLSPCNLFARGKKERPVETKVITELQDRYDSLEAPAVIMLPVTGTSGVSAEYFLQIEKELSKQLVDNGKLKPIVMQKWLTATYRNSKAANPFSFMNAIKAEQYVLPIQYVCKAYVFKSDARYFLTLNLYPLATFYPVTIFRIFTTSDEIPEAITSCLEELNVRLFQQIQNDSRRRIVIDKFKVELLQLVVLQSGEFEFVATPFIEEAGVSIREGDDFFSNLLGYILSSTNLFRVIRPSDFDEYANANIDPATVNADYKIQGRVQLSGNECVLYTDLLDIHNGAKLVSLRYPLPDYSLESMWKAYREISVAITGRIYNQDSYGVVPVLSSPDYGFFANNMFVGWDSLENFVLPRGLHTINTGSFYHVIDYAAGGNVKQKNTSGKIKGPHTYYVLLDTMSRVYTDSEGEHIWNLLKK
jgi:hypothetical protein